MAEEFLRRGWNVVGTVRGEARTRLHDLAESSAGQVEIETLDITLPDQISAVRSRLATRTFDMLFVNAGITNNPKETIAEVSTDEFVRVMVTNALSPMRVVEALHDLVVPDGTIGVMSSGQGSVSRRAMVLMAPGWVRTGLGGPDGRLSIEESVPNVVITLLAARGNPGLQYLDYLGRVVPW